MIGCTCWPHRDCAPCWSRWITSVFDLRSHVNEKWRNIQSIPMSSVCFRAPTLDDAMRMIFEEILQEWGICKAAVLAFPFCSGVPEDWQSLQPPRQSRTWHPFGCLGELCWYLASSNDVEFIAYYLSRYRDFEEEGSSARIAGTHLPLEDIHFFHLAISEHFSHAKRASSKAMNAIDTSSNPLVLGESG
jgi:hypothetical protein